MNVDSQIVHVSDAACLYLISMSAKSGTPVHCPDMVREVADVITKQATRFMVTSGMVWWEGHLDGIPWTVSANAADVD